jgi:ABC-type antimicrobial peptide transport system, ATPase component
MIIVRTRELTKDFYLGKTVIQALRGVDIEIEEGEFMAIAGPSGSGKTTLLNLIGCIDIPTGGHVDINGSDVTGWSANKLAELRASTIGFIFQTFNLIPVLSAYENVEYPLLRKNIRRDERKEKVREALESVGLKKFVRHRPDEMSGGQRQRVAIARALATDPRIILADEPTANLDHQTGLDVLKIMRRINKEKGTTFIFSTHDPKILATANRVVELFDGIVEG